MAELQITARETDIVRLKMRGLSNKKIASQLGIAESTVKTHLGHLFDKYDSDNVTELCCKIIIISLSDNRKKYHPFVRIDRNGVTMF